MICARYGWHCPIGFGEIINVFYSAIVSPWKRCDHSLGQIWILFTRPANIFWSFSNHMGYINYTSHFQWPRVKSKCPHLLNRRPHPFTSLFFYLSWFMSFFQVTQGFDNFWSFQATQSYEIVVSIQVAHSCSNWRDSRLWRLSPNLSDTRLWQPWHCFNTLHSTPLTKLTA